MGALAQLETGQLIDNKYVVDSLLGQGGMSQVFRARHRLTGREVALKWVASGDGHKQARLLREARSVSQIKHPNVVEILDAGECEGAVYMAMSYIAGTNLRSYASGRRFSPAEAIRLLKPALDGVEAAHRAGFIHRDIKPANLLVCFDDANRPIDTKVLDFGVAKALKEETDSRLTRTGTMVGTPKYMAPEQILGEPQVDFTTDIYALSLVLYRLLTGRTPFSRSSEEGLARDIVLGRLTPLRELVPDLPEGLCAIVQRGTATGQVKRWPSIATLRTALLAFQDSEIDSSEWFRTPSLVPPEATATIPQSQMKSRTEIPVATQTDARLSLSATQETAPTSVLGRKPQRRAAFWFVAGAAALLLAWTRLPMAPGTDHDEPPSVPETDPPALRTSGSPVAPQTSPAKEPSLQAPPDPEPKKRPGKNTPDTSPSRDPSPSRSISPSHATASPQPAPPEPAAPPRPPSIPMDSPTPSSAPSPRTRAVESRAGLLRAEDF